MVHRSIDCSTWDDPWFAELAPKAKLLFLFLITNRRVTQCGAMEITVRQIEFETGLSSAEVPNLIESFGDRVHWWHEHSLLIVRNFYRHQRANTGDKFDIAAQKSAEVLPVFAREWVYGLYPHLAPDGWVPLHTHPIPTQVGSYAPDIGSEAEAEAGVPPEGGQTDQPNGALPEHGDAQTIVARFCEAAGIERPASYPKAAGIAREIAKAGVRPEQIADLYTFTASRWKGRADLGKMLNAIDEWRSKPVHPPPQNGHGPKFTLEDELAYRRQRGMDVPRGVGT